VTWSTHHRTVAAVLRRGDHDSGWWHRVRPLRLDQFGLATEAREVVSDYLSRLGERLPGGRRARSLVLAEIADGLACAVDARVEDGQSPADAAHAAVGELGEPDQVAAAFARRPWWRLRSLSVGCGRRGQHRYAPART
jgi:hypothetical protein